MSNDNTTKFPDSSVPGTNAIPPAPAKRKKKKGKKLLIILILVAVVAAAAVFFFLRRNNHATASTLTEYTVSRGNIQVVISGSGTVEPNEQYDVTSLVSGDITADYFEEGQQIKKGDLLYTIDTKDAESNVAQNENSLQRAQNSYNDALEALQNLKVKSSITGLVTGLQVAAGDQVQQNSVIAKVADTSSLVLTVPFLASDASKISAGQSAQVTLASHSLSVSGTVSRVYTGQRTSDSGALVTDVDITFSNPGTVRSGDSASATVAGKYACNEAGTVAYATDGTITAKTSGQITSLSIKAGDRVTAGSVVAVLSSDTAQSNLDSAKLSLENAELSLQNVKDQMDNYNITSPIAGTVVEKTSKAGDKISNNSSSTSMAVIADMSQLVLDIDVDELDILKLKVGQTATITADALEGESFTGTVSNISTMGTSSSSEGVTTYTVRIVIPEYGDLLPGMNVDAEIQVESAEDVLTVPVDAIVRGNYVLVKSDTASSSAAPQSSSAPQSSGSETDESATAAGQRSQTDLLGNTAPAGYQYVQVETGLSNDESIEITSGLSEGDVIAYTPDTPTSSNTTMPAMGGGITGGITGGGGGGMPAGGGSGQGPGGGQSSGYQSSSRQSSSSQGGGQSRS